MPELPENPWSSRTFDNLLAEMLDEVPATMDKTVGSFIYDSLAPVAAAMADAFLKADILRQAAFVDTAAGAYLDGHVEAHGLSRNAAVQALGVIRVTALESTVVPAGTQFSTLADPNISAPAVTFFTDTIGQVQPRRGTGTFQETDLSIIYTGTWNTDANSKYSNVNNDTARIYFNGTQIVIRFRSGTDKGIAAISIDGGAETTHDLYAAAPGTIDVTKGSLSADNHYATVRVTNTKNASSSNFYIPIDHYVITGGAAIITDFVDIPIIALNGGEDGNVGSGSITRLVSAINNVVSVTNPNATAGGKNEETDDELRARFKEHISEPPASGNKADYVRWALEATPLVGAADVQPLWAGAGTVKVFVLDTNNSPASAPILEVVEDYIIGTGGAGTGKAPIGATVTVVAPTTVPIDVQVTLTYVTGYDVATVKEAVIDAITTYIQNLTIADTVRFSGIFNAIHDVPGVLDLSSLTFRRDAAGFAATNIVLAAGEKAVRDVVTIS